MSPRYQRWRPASTILLLIMVSACRGATGSAPAAGQPAAEYDQQTGKLTALVSDRDGDGKPDTWAHMDGATLKSIEIDENGDGKPDRWESYAAPSPAGSQPLIERAEEAGHGNGRITRREFYVAGQLQRTEDDTDADGRADKWEYYEAGTLARVDMDVQGKGFPDRRLVYRNGAVDHAEADPDGDGRFERVVEGGTSR